MLKNRFSEDEWTVAAVYDRRYSLIPGKTGAHRAPLQLLDFSFSASR
jgi:hypothetical protein